MGILIDAPEQWCKKRPEWMVLRDFGRGSGTLSGTQEMYDTSVGHNRLVGQHTRLDDPNSIGRDGLIGECACPAIEADADDSEVCIVQCTDSKWWNLYPSGIVGRYIHRL
jgi:hypothetical protein